MAVIITNFIIPILVFAFLILFVVVIRRCKTTQTRIAAQALTDQNRMRSTQLTRVTEPILYPTPAPRSHPFPPTHPNASSPPLSTSNFFSPNPSSLNSMPVSQPLHPNPIIPNTSAPPPFATNILPPNFSVNHMPVPQTLLPNASSPSSLISPPNRSVNPVPVPQVFPPVVPVPSSPLQATSNLIDRMRQVQTLMIEIHRLESESGERNSQRVQELRQRVIELSDTNGQEPVHGPAEPTPDSLQPPPAYSPRDNDSERPELGNTSG